VREERTAQELAEIDRTRAVGNDLHAAMIGAPARSAVKTTGIAPEI
jgi:hypothetical protein